MRIFLVRHGDAMGGLMDFGRGQISRTADFFKSLGLDASKTVLLTSQLPRAVETAEIIRQTLGLGEVLPKSWLRCGTSENTATSLAQFAVDNADFTAVIAVSHMPEIENLLGKLGFNGAAGNGSVHEIEFQSRTVARLFQP
ncbi:MAG: hypothetical protein A2651_02310 [Candidatus Yanofskybacteria bacterium RIFCSPHIGHO2_01_FULL_42_12]|uniref:Phosphohistidine phosphatase SixA n=1 Tax=Candidatus Yanofskybacteria bacterium RIFCSPLOWO2_01_FULL_42_49 TaxID=1802694 RepID=A0A1F8GBN3_9BACT|nr:MAG: hypothetical protein A2651_02310 [Candidatus Yanofskybacteria bacterium RIFCSPHIGHO2_01_FULL_42_12]OGN22787.1 MAG: hypothetical protein A2918_01465 [Candidatus Yanofskybacteria bacterium RIFCSPLOWO2_01_FULL_42_49]